MLEDYSEGETAAMESEMHIKKEPFHCGELLEGYLLNEPWLRKSPYRMILRTQQVNRRFSCSSDTAWTERRTSSINKQIQL